SGDAIAMCGVGASGSASSAIGAVTAEGPEGRSTGGASADRCARAFEQTRDIRPTNTEIRRTHLPVDLECIFPMTAPFRIRTKLSEVMSPPAPLLIAAEGQTQEIG